MRHGFNAVPRISAGRWRPVRRGCRSHRPPA